jgi:hypothetical protein
MTSSDMPLTRIDQLLRSFFSSFRAAGTDANRQDPIDLRSPLPQGGYGDRPGSTRTICAVLSRQGGASSSPANRARRRGRRCGGEMVQALGRRPAKDRQTMIARGIRDAEVQEEFRRPRTTRWHDRNSRECLLKMGHAFGYIYTLSYYMAGSPCGPAAPGLAPRGVR